MGLLFSAAFCCLSGPVTCTAAPPLCIGGGDWLYAAVVALEAGEGMGARVLRLAHATPAARTVVRVFVAAPSRSVGPVHGWGPPPPHAVGPPSAIGPISPRAVFRAVGGLSASAKRQLPRTRAFLSPRENWAGRAPSPRC